MTYTASAEKKGWKRDFFEKIGLPEFARDNFELIGENVEQVLRTKSSLIWSEWSKCCTTIHSFLSGNVVQKPGEAVGSGLTREAAQALGLKEGTAVGTSLVDAHAGGLGDIFCPFVSSQCISHQWFSHSP